MTPDDMLKSSQQPVFLLKSASSQKEAEKIWELFWRNKVIFCMKRECKGLRKHHSKRKSLSKCYFRREWKWKYLQMSKNITTDFLSYQLWWMIFIPIQAFATCTINFDPVPLTDNPSMIGHKAFASLSNDPMEAFNPMPSTPPELTTLQTPTLQSSSFKDNRVSEDVIQSLVIPSKSKGVGDIL